MNDVGGEHALRAGREDAGDGLVMGGELALEADLRQLALERVERLQILDHCQRGVAEIAPKRAQLLPGGVVGQPPAGRGLPRLRLGGHE